jgi:hypothetical protein
MQQGREESVWGDLMKSAVANLTEEDMVNIVRRRLATP